MQTDRNTSYLATEDTASVAVYITCAYLIVLESSRLVSAAHGVDRRHTKEPGQNAQM
jgi:hypothetical protein